MHNGARYSGDHPRPHLMVACRATKTHSWVCPRARDQRIHVFDSVSNRRAMTDVRAWLGTQEGEHDSPGTLTVYRDAAGDVRELDAEIERLKQERYRLIDVYTDGDITRADFRAIKDAIEAAMQHLGQRAVAVMEQQPAAGDDLEPALSRLYDD